MIRTFLFFVFGYFSGSILFARVYGTLFNKDIMGKSKDKNPGAANAFMQGGMLCGTLTLIGDILKGFLPVFLFLKVSGGAVGFGIALVLAAPVLGHNYSVFYRFEGGKGIATSFGCLLGLFPRLLPALILAFCYITLSVVVRISPHYYRTLAAYFAAAVIALFLVPEAGIRTGMAVITALIIIKHLASAEEKSKFGISLPAADSVKKLIRKAK
ncbi:MAG: glycerol-3-phosphate acyltransferase [Acutalibacteraceae bacterium]|nr:glycerol-3-phosphate acyltransferase [Acutalibacteraceae bacterium]